MLLFVLRRYMRQISLFVQPRRWRCDFRFSRTIPSINTKGSLIANAASRRPSTVRPYRIAGRACAWAKARDNIPERACSCLSPLLSLWHADCALHAVHHFEAHNAPCIRECLTALSAKHRAFLPESI